MEGGEEEDLGVVAARWTKKWVEVKKGEEGLTVVRDVMRSLEQVGAMIVLQGRGGVERGPLLARSQYRNKKCKEPRRTKKEERRRKEKEREN